MLARALARVFETRATPPMHPKDPALADFFGPAPVNSGVTVTDRTVLGLPAVWACVRVIAETLGIVPLVMYERVGERAKRRAVSHPLYAILHHRPNPEMTASEYREALAVNACLRGNFVAEKQRNPRTGAVEALWPIQAWRVMPFRDSKGVLWYKVALPERTGGGFAMLRSDEVHHVRTMSDGGPWSLSPIDFGRETFGLAIAQEQFGSRFFAQGASLSGVLQMPEGKRLADPAARKRLMEDWSRLREGLTNAHRTAILEDGMTYQRIGVPPENAQFLESRKFQIQEVCRWFRMPSHKVVDYERATFNNIEHLGLEFVTDTMMPWFVRIEQAVLRDLLSPREQENFFAAFVVQGLLRGDTAARTAYYREMWTKGIMNADEIRELEDMNPQPDGIGEVYYVPANMVPAGTQRDPGAGGGGGRARRRRNGKAGPPIMRSEIQVHSDHPIEPRETDE